MNAYDETKEFSDIPGFPGYTFTADGLVFKDGLPKIVSCKKERAAKIIIRSNKKMYTFGFAKLIANAFIPNPNNYTKIIFKDRNHHNCRKENIQWVSNSEWGFYSRNKSGIKHVDKKIKKIIPTFPIVENCELKNLIGFPDYYITSDARVFKKGILKSSFFKKCIKIRIGKKEYSLGKLLARHFIPNPNNYSFIIYIDRNNKNCKIENIKWVSNEEYLAYALGHKRYMTPKKEKSEKVKKVRVKKEKVLSWRALVPNLEDVEIVELINEDLPGIYITSDGRAFKGLKQIHVNRKNKAPSLRVQKNHKKYYFGFAKLVASYFVPNPKNYNHVICRDYNNENCEANNLIWVTGDLFFEYCCGDKWRQGRKKIVLERSYAIANCKDNDMRAYYISLDEVWLEECWNKIEKGYRHFFWWRDVKSECYMYFIDRAKRFSIIVPAASMLWYFAKGQRIKLHNEISPDITKYQASKIDETLRNKESGHDYDSGGGLESW